MIYGEHYSNRGDMRMNILFFLNPKNEVAYIEEDDTLRQALEKMEHHKYTSIPILSNQGTYVGTITEGDLLWYCKEKNVLNARESESIPITDVPRRTTYHTVSISSTMEDLFSRAVHQNFVPVEDDGGHFIGIVTRRSIMKYVYSKLAELEKV